MVITATRRGAHTCSHESCCCLHICTAHHKCHLESVQLHNEGHESFVLCRLLTSDMLACGHNSIKKNSAKIIFIFGCTIPLNSSVVYNLDNYMPWRRADVPQTEIMDELCAEAHNTSICFSQYLCLRAVFHLRLYCAIFVQGHQVKTVSTQSCCSKPGGTQKLKLIRTKRALNLSEWLLISVTTNLSSTLAILPPFDIYCYS